MIEYLIHPPNYTFSRVLTINPTVDFAAGLSAPSPPINLVTLSLLQKAEGSQTDSDIVAGAPEVVAALIRLWLCTPNTAVAQMALRVFLALLGQHEQEPSRSLMWRRVFRDKDIYSSIFSICSLDTVGEHGQLSKRDKTVAQARLLDFLAKTGSSAPVRCSQFPEIEAKYKVQDGGLLGFAAIHMVEIENDVLMHITLINFFVQLLQVSSLQTPKSSAALDFLLEHGLHARTISFYIESEKYDRLDLKYIYSQSANYLSVYCCKFREHFLSQPSVVNSLLLHIGTVLEGVSASQWAQNDTPKPDLHVLSSLPRALLFSNGQSCPLLLLLPSQPASADAYNTLATIFRGPDDDFRTVEDISAARAAYFFYVRQFPAFWTHVVQAADTIALKDAALAAIKLIGAVINADWTPLAVEGPSAPYRLPSEQELVSEHHSGRSLPSSGILAILDQPAADSVIPYLMRPAPTFSNMVGGRGETESAAYHVAVAKHDVLIEFHRKLKHVIQGVNDSVIEGILKAVEHLLAQGPFGGNAQVGGRIATLEL